MSFNNGNVWHSYEYSWQKAHHADDPRHQTWGFNIQHGNGHLITGLILEGRIPAFNKFTQKKTDKIFTRKLQRVLRFNLFPVIAINPNIHFYAEKTSVNIKPRLGIMYKSKSQAYQGGVVAKLTYGFDIPGTADHFYDYNRQIWQLQLGFNIPGRPNWR
jgi:hypothetical protein